MSPVTEIVVVPLKPDVDPAALATIWPLIASQPGCLAVRWAPQHEDASQLALFIDWADVAAHRAFASDQNPDYQTMLSALSPAMAATPTPYHVTFEPFPPAALSGVGTAAPAAEVLHAYFAPDADMTTMQEALTAVDAFVAATRKGAAEVGEAAYGWTLEGDTVEHEGRPARALVLVVGWASVEAHARYRGTTEFKESIGLLRGMRGLKGMKVFHVMSNVVKGESA